jgi:hypothetical protein
MGGRGRSLTALVASLSHRLFPLAFTLHAIADVSTTNGMLPLVARELLRHLSYGPVEWEALAREERFVCFTSLE